MRIHRAYTIAVVPLLLGLVLAVEPAAAASHGVPPVPLQASCPSGTSEFCDILNRLQTILIATLSGLGIVMFLVGALLWFTAGPRSEWAGRGKWAMIGGAAMVIIAQTVNLIRSILDYIAGGSATIAPWRLIESLGPALHHTVIPLVLHAVPL